MLEKLRRYGLAGVLSYGLLNTAYYSVAFLFVWRAPLPVLAGVAANNISTVLNAVSTTQEACTVACALAVLPMSAACPLSVRSLYPITPDTRPFPRHPNAPDTRSYPQLQTPGTQHPTPDIWPRHLTGR